MPKADKNIFYIPAGMAFSHSLADQILKEASQAPETLPRTLIFMPTRRACRILQESFTELSKDKPILLPRIQPIGDLDEEDLSFTLTHNFRYADSLPAAMPGLQRQMILAHILQAKDPLSSPEQSLSLAQALGRLMDQIYTENLSLKNIEKLVPSIFAEHWQITIDFLKILSEHWPKILKEKNQIDESDHRNLSILTLAQAWEKNPPDFPVIAAGSTGSIPATAILLSVIANLPKGKVVLPGFDPDLDEKSWNTLDETHPQYGFKLLLKRIECERTDIKPWPNTALSTKLLARQTLIREVMRPSATSDLWTKIKSNQEKYTAIKSAFEDLSLINCKNENEEASCVSVIIREALEKPDQKICVITPDRNLAARIQSACKRWDLDIDDSAGKSLERTSLGQFLILVYNVFESDFSPLNLLALLKHKYCYLGLNTHEKSQAIEALDLSLRGLKPAKGLNAIAHRINHTADISEQSKTKALELINLVSNAFRPLIDFKATSFDAYIRAHLETSEYCAVNNNENNKNTLWQTPEGKTAAEFFTGLFKLNDLNMLDHLNLKDHYKSLFLYLIKNISVRPAFGTHPRVQILGQMEARLIDADLVVLCGLNEGIWPPDSDADPWMSRPMRKAFGLPSLERKIGLAAHDFVQAFCAPKVIITRSEKSRGTLTVPARWLQRLSAVLQACELPKDLLLSDMPLLDWAHALDYQSPSPRATRPMPCPPLDKRPQRLSVTRIEKWMKDPYTIYAQSILKLEKLRPLEQNIDAALYGDILHDILEKFSTSYPATLPDNVQKELIIIAQTTINSLECDEEIWQFWWPKFLKIINWLEHHEQQWRQTTKLLATEAYGTMNIDSSGQSFELYGYADRIDVNDHGGAIIIDYKSAGTFSPNSVYSAHSPQLPLEALILKAGGFKNLSALKPVSLQYWVLNGSGEGAKLIEVHEDLETLLEETYNGLLELIKHYQNPLTPYICLPRSDTAPRFNDYEHLARIQEWAAAGEDEGGEP